jgi:hypothetical protein
MAILQLGAHGQDGGPQHGVPPVHVQKQEDESRGPESRADPHNHLEVVLQETLDVFLKVKLAARGQMHLKFWI